MFRFFLLCTAVALSALVVLLLGLRYDGPAYQILADALLVVVVASVALTSFYSWLGLLNAKSEELPRVFFTAMLLYASAYAFGLMGLFAFVQLSASLFMLALTLSALLVVMSTTYYLVRQRHPRLVTQTA